ncbi:MAG: hypothetical protein IRY99_18065 [Isosphaeraceae bacterium]|nr:hypothetical protein [Isosphaeraceae bacterium]
MRRAASHTSPASTAKHAAFHRSSHQGDYQRFPVRASAQSERPKATSVADAHQQRRRAGGDQPRPATSSSRPSTGHRPTSN